MSLSSGFLGLFCVKRIGAALQRNITFFLATFFVIFPQYIQWMFTEGQLSARHCSTYWEDEGKSENILPKHGFLFILNEIRNPL